MKKLSLIFLSFLIGFQILVNPITTFAETGTLAPPENVKQTDCPPSYVGEKKCFYVDNPKLKDKPKTKITTPKPIPSLSGGGSSAPIRAVLYLMSMALSATDATQKLETEFWANVDWFDQKAGIIANNLTDTAKQELADAWIAMENSDSRFMILSKSTLSALQHASREVLTESESKKLAFETMHAYDISASMNSGRAYQARQKQQQYGQLVAVSVAGMTPNYYAYFGVLHDPTLGYRPFQVNVMVSNGNVIWYDYYRNYNEILWQPTRELAYKALQSDPYDLPYVKANLSSNLVDTIADPVQRSNDRLYIPPSLHGNANPVAPGVTQIDDKQYWEVPYTEPDGEPNIEYEPIREVESPTERERTIVTDDGLQVDPDTGQTSPTPIVTPIPIPTDETTTDPETDPETQPMWKTLIVTLTGIGTTVGNIYDKIKTCKACTEIPDVWNPWTLFAPYLAFMLAALTFLGAIAAMLVKLPLIPRKPFPEPYNEVVEWFRQFSYGGIVIYDVMISLTFLLLGFYIYKLIRRSL